MYVTLGIQRNGYSPDQCGSTMTVGELIQYLSQYDESTKIYYSNDNGYTYGSIKDYLIEEHDEEESED